MAQTCAYRGATEAWMDVNDETRERQSPDWRIARRHSGEWRSRARRKARKHRKLSHAAADYFAVGGGVTTAVNFRIMPSDLLKT